MGEMMTKELHEEFEKRMDEANRNQLERIEELEKNCRYKKRIETLEEEVRQIRALTASIQELTVEMRSMRQEQERQGKHLDTLESRDGEMWRKVTGYIVTAVVGIIIGFVFKQIGM